jgi:hypothetical protein
MLQVEKDFVEKIDGIAHQDDDQPGNDADQRGEQNETRFPRPHQGAKPPGDFHAGRDFTGHGATGGR